LQAFADRRAADFTRIRFWRHRVLDLSGVTGTRVLARFDDGSPAWATLPVGRGQIFVMSAGFAPADSQLGLSSKLVPLLFALLDASAGPAAELAPRFVGDRLPLPGAVSVLRPDGVRVAADTGDYADTDLPGLYRNSGGGGTQELVLAVNVPPAESATAPLALEILERAGLPLKEGASAGQGAVVRAPVGENERRAAFFASLEANQKPWRWVLFGALLLVFAESLLTLRAARRRAPVAAEATGGTS
jgi:hypothetical protein